MGGWVIQRPNIYPIGWIGWLVNLALGFHLGVGAICLWLYRD